MSNILLSLIIFALLTIKFKLFIQLQIRDQLKSI